MVQQAEIRYVVWRARRDSNPRPADPKSDARGSALAPLSRAQPRRPSGSVWVEIQVSMVLVSRKSLVPTAKSAECQMHAPVSPECLMLAAGSRHGQSTGSPADLIMLT